MYHHSPLPIPTHPVSLRHVCARRLLTALMLACGLAAHAQDALPGRAASHESPRLLETITATPCEIQCAEAAAVCRELTLQNLLAVLDEYGVKHKEVVAAQAILETGHFTSELCLNAHNLFGLRHPSDGSYYTFDNWEQSVKAYRDDVQYKYQGGDYYAFLSRIGYAQDRRYTVKVRRIERDMFADVSN